MTTIDLVYDGHQYTVPDADLDQLRQHVLDVVAGAPAFWLTANHGAGSYRPVELLVAPGVALAVSVAPPQGVQGSVPVEAGPAAA